MLDPALKLVKRIRAVLHQVWWWFAFAPPIMPMSKWVDAPTQLDLAVTKEDISHGRDGYVCPVALAARRAFASDEYEIVATVKGVSIRRGANSLWHLYRSDALSQWISSFDQDPLNAEPVAFSLKS